MGPAQAYLVVMAATDDDEPLVKSVEKVNGRLIRRVRRPKDTIWLVETWEDWNGQDAQVWQAFESLEAAREAAIRFGPLPTRPED
jgi:hypothetical protein